MQTDAILAIDIGGGTQDILLYRAGQPVENCVQLILPSPTRVVAHQVEEATSRRQTIFLYGSLMGGGACSRAIQRHLKAGLEVYAQPAAAKTLHDDLERVTAMGVQLVDAAPAGAVAIRTGDVRLDLLAAALEPFGVALPATVAVAVQDHGESPGESNRLFRFRHWERLLVEGGNLETLVYPGAIPTYLTRMQAVRQDVPGAMLMDTGAAAIWGALCDPVVAARQERGLTVVNIGNQHTVAVLLVGNQIWGMMEHHTSLLNGAKLRDFLDRMRSATLTHQEIFADEGHGCYLRSGLLAAGDFSWVAVTGPRREMVRDQGYYQAVPFGDMMLSGCFGLVAACRAKSDE